MQQYSPKNQEFLLEQLPTATDVRSFKAWAAEGRRVKKGEKALKVYCPIVSRGKKNEGTAPTLEQMTDSERPRWFKTGNVFDVSQTETIEEWKARQIDEEQEVAS